jgi:AcrR family transcriptional regulator
MPVTTQARSAGSRELILDAAVACVVEEGYAGATTLRVQQRAGVSRGRLLHHFPSREVLLAAAAEHLALARIRASEQMVRDILANLPDDPERSEQQRCDQCVELMWESYHGRHFWAATELWLASRTSQALAEVLLPAERQIGETLRMSLEHSFGYELAKRPRFRELCRMLLTSMRGAALTYASPEREPSTEPMLTEWKALAREMLGLPPLNSQS